MKGKHESIVGGECVGLGNTVWGQRKKIAKSSSITEGSEDVPEQGGESWDNREGQDQLRKRR